ncbi:MAG TPA: EutN/CcmL family microcompartment protein [Oscillospiraceae bacterium]|nr:EutN/CcmL family microcompartment protein [Oscillospiraceae bacterium]
MIICEVVGNVWATKKEENLEGLKLMVVKQIDYFSKNEGNSFVAADVVGAGTGEKVLVVNGSTARKVFGHAEVPIDAVIVGIIDSLEVEQSL